MTRWLSTIIRSLARSVVIIMAMAPGMGIAQSVSFKSDWETGIIGAGRFKETHQKAGDRFIQSTNAPRKGKYSAQITVRPGDILFGGERSEALKMLKANGSSLNENTASGTQYYAISTRLATDWRSPSGSLSSSHPNCSTEWGWGVVFQLHGPDTYGASPAFALQVWDTQKSGDKFTVSLTAGTVTPGPNVNDVGKTYDLSRNSLALGRWVDWIFQIKWADDKTGLVKIWRRDAGQTAFTQVFSKSGIATLQRTRTERGLPHYWKTGFYRSTCSITNRLWIEGPARGTTFDAVRNALWGG